MENKNKSISEQNAEKQKKMQKESERLLQGIMLGALGSQLFKDEIEDFFDL